MAEYPGPVRTYGLNHHTQQARHGRWESSWWKRGRSRTLALLAFLLLLGAKSGTEEFALNTAGGVYTLPVRINDMITLDFLLDTGATDVQIPADVALTLVRTRTITAEDFLPGATYTLADGTPVRSPRLVVRSLWIGAHRITNVTASLGPPSLTSSPILGMSFLKRLGTFSIDTARGVLILGPIKMADKPPPREETKPGPSRTASDAQTSAFLEGDTCTRWQIAPIECALGFVRAYYEDLGRRDAQEALGKWKEPPASVQTQLQREKLQSITSFEIHNVQRVNGDPRFTWVEADVTEYRLNKPTAWSVMIKLERVQEAWKILEIKARK